MRGHRVVIIDPVGDSNYGKVAKAINGAYAAFGVGSSSKFNPCDLGGDYLNLQILAGATDDDDEEEVRRKARAGALDGKIISLTRLVALMVADDDGHTTLSQANQGIVDMIWARVYDEKGITSDPSTHDRTPPTMQDFFRHLATEERLATLRDQLYPWEYGPLRTFFDSHTNIDLDNKYLVFQIAGISGREKAAIMYALLDFLNGRLSNPDELSDLFIDEFWSMLRYPMAATFSEEMFRSGRARNNAMVAITQDVEEFVDSKSGQVILRIAATHLILKQRKKTVEVLNDFYDFSEEQEQEVLNFAAGQGILVVEENQIPLYVMCSEYENRLFNTDSKKKKEYEKDEREQKRRALESGRSLDPALPAARRDNASLPAPTVRKLSGAGIIRELLDNDDTRTPRPDDYEDLPVLEPVAHDPAPEQDPAHSGGSLSDGDPSAYAPNGHAPNGHAPNGQFPPDAARRYDTTELSPLAPTGEHPPPTRYSTPEPRRSAGDVINVSVPSAEDGAIFAVFGPTAPVVAYNLAALMARAAKNDNRYVLLVDAERTLSETLLTGYRQPDPLAGGGYLWDYTTDIPSTNLAYMAFPSHEGVPGAGIARLAREEADLIIVACGLSMYGRDWMTAADKVIATDDRGRSLESTLRNAQEVRGHNGTLLAPMGKVKLKPELMSHAVYRLPSRTTPAIKDSEENGTLAALNDPETASAFRPLFDDLLDATRKDALSR